MKTTILAALCFVPALLLGIEKSDCSKEVLFSFYPKEFVVEALTNHKVDAAKTSVIADELAGVDNQVIQMIESRAAGMDPNPLKDDKDTMGRAALYKNVIAEIFTETVKKQGITDPDQILAILDEIQALRFKRFEECKKSGFLPEMPVMKEKE